MAAPLVAGAVALILQRYPTATPSQIYNAIQNNAITDAFTGSVPNSTWGYGKLDILDAINDPAVPVELSSFSASTIWVQLLNLTGEQKLNRKIMVSK